MKKPYKITYTFQRPGSAEIKKGLRDQAIFPDSLTSLTRYSITTIAKKGFFYAIVTDNDCS
jgi:hypothetical protein